MLQFITNTESSVSVSDQIKAFIKGGGRWVQVRMKDASDEEITKVIEEIKPLCIETETFLILDDRVELAKTLDVGGVHLGKEDMLPSKARMILGPAAVIGVTANTIDDVKAVRSLDIDYIGIGPFAQTSTKKNLSPILGIEGIKSICTQMNDLEINISHVAVGGIKREDVAALMEAGVNGIAVSGAIANAPDIIKATEDFLDTLKPFLKA
ncbi:MAG: thiamine phosphate synthase [Bacteroidales bacterium]|nr:thiamine phosphate synthase [Bacteroidales bacterium]MBD5205812.1 thiamine phosphate synthase [Bacteroidales bacterium]MBD5223791.1 thiamine phosphate synthase [Bacteroidales bacterium]MBD5302346.1 thiamine phosphate synthase [Bacteroides sp.]